MLQRNIGLQCDDFAYNYLLYGYIENEHTTIAYALISVSLTIVAKPLPLEINADHVVLVAGSFHSKERFE